MDEKSRTNRSENTNTTGSPHKGEPVFLAIGVVRKPHGIRGEVSFELTSDFPERIKVGRKVYLGDNHIEYSIKSVRFLQDTIYISLSGIDNREDTEKIRNQVIYVYSSELPKLDSNFYYHHQIIGLNVVDTNNAVLGRVVDIIETGSNDVYVVSLDDKGQDLLIPAVQSVIINIDLNKSVMIVKLPIWG